MATGREELFSRLISPLVVETIFDRMPDVVFFVKNVQGQYIQVNHTLAERCGFDNKAALIGKTTLEVFPPPLAECYASQDRLVLETGRDISDMLELHLYRDRRPGWCLTNKFQLRDSDGVVGLAGISKDLPEPNMRAIAYAQVAQAVEHIKLHLADRVSVADLAALVGLSPKRLERNIGAIFQLTVGQLITKARIDHAAYLLSSSKMPVSAVAQACGFYDHAAFSRQFKTIVAVTPTEFRLLRNGPQKRPG